MGEHAPLVRYFKETKIPLRLATADESRWPVVLSLWYLYEDGFLYCATQESAKVVGYLRSEPRCGYEIASDLPPYCGVRGRAVAMIDASRGMEILERLLQRYLGGLDSALAQTLLKRKSPEVAIQLRLESATTWNFTGRMSEFQDSQRPKACPET